MATKGIPSVPDIPPQLSLSDIYRILEPLARIISIRQGKFDPLDRWITMQDLIDFGLQTESSAEAPVVTVPPTQEYPFRLAGDVIGGPTTMGTGDSTTMSNTAINLPNVVCIDGGNAASTFPGAVSGPYGVAAKLEVRDEGIIINSQVDSLDFVGAGVTVTEPSPDNLRVTISAGGGGGELVALDDTDISGSPTEHKITWDESLYSDIFVVVSGVQSASDLLDLRCTLGEANGATMHETSGDYTGSHQTNFATTRSALSGADLATPQIANNTSNVAGETISGIIRIMGAGGSKGAVYHSVMHYINSAGNRETLDEQVMLTSAAAAGAVDTYRLVFATSAAFANVGNIKTFGLQK